MVKIVFCKRRADGVELYRSYSEQTNLLKQLPTGIIYDTWSYKLDENGNNTNEIDWNMSGVIDIENSPYTYEEVFDEVK